MSDPIATPPQPPPSSKRPPRDAQTRPVQVEVRAQGGYTESVTLTIAALTERARFLRAAKTSAMLFGMAVASLPIPPIHWLLVPGFLIASVIAFFVRIRTGELLSGTVPCPKCRGTFALESQPPSWPLDLTCHVCKAQLTAAPTP